LCSPANRSDFCVSPGKAPNRQRAVSIPRIPRLLPLTAAPLRYALMIDAITDPIMGVSIAKNSCPVRFAHCDVVKSVNTPAPTPKNTISLMLKDACGGGAVLWACWGGGGTGASASGVGTCAVRWTGLPQVGQNRSSGLNSCPQLPQNLSGTSAILPCLFRLLGHVVGHPLDAHRLASMLLLHLISIRESEYHANCLFSGFLCQEVAELLRRPIRRSSFAFTRHWSPASHGTGISYSSVRKFMYATACYIPCMHHVGAPRELFEGSVGWIFGFLHPNFREFLL
jgi:hypothetical protein